MLKMLKMLKNAKIPLRVDKPGFVDGKKAILEQWGLFKELEHILHRIVVGI